MKVPIVQLSLPQYVLDNASEVLKSGQWVDGTHVHQLEKDFASFCGMKFCRGVSNGTAALMTIMASLGIKPRDEVIVPSFSFIATANCIEFLGATPVFADIKPDTFNMDPADVKKKITPKTKAIMPVHLFGLCAEMKIYQEICEEKGLFLIEDACQAHGAAINGKKAGSFGVAAAFSLYPTKNMFSGGEGGLITTSDTALFDKMKLYMNHGQAERYKHVMLGFNFRMAEVNATIAQYCLVNLPQWNAQRQKNAVMMSSLFEKDNRIITPTVPAKYSHVFHQYTIRSPIRDKIIDALKKEDIGFGIHYAIPIHKQEFYQNLGYGNKKLPNTEKAAQEVLSLPIHPLLTEAQLNFVAQTIRSIP